jgi:hypothetical protein
LKKNSGPLAIVFPKSFPEYCNSALERITVVKNLGLYNVIAPEEKV